MTSVDIPSTIQIPASIPTGTQITVVATAMDGAHNAAHPDTLMLHTGAGGAAAVIVTNPHASDTAVVGFSLAVAVSGKAPAKVKSLGYIASGVFATPFRDSVIFTSPLLDSIALDTALSLVGASTGTLTITPFMIDSLGRQTLGAPVSLFVTNIVPTNTVPVVDFQIADRIESRDTIHVEARDRSGDHLGWLRSAQPAERNAVLRGGLGGGASEHQLGHAHVPNESSRHVLPDVAAGPGLRSQREHP